jgi:glutaminyl-tRNA synthetase
MPCGGWAARGNGDNLYYASNYFDWMVEFAEYLISAGHAYVDSQSADEMRANRGTLTEPGKDSPFRNRSAEENLDLFKRMQAGEFADGTHVLRAKIDMASPNINLRDPAIYRIRHATHHNTGDKWCVYPMYTFAHPIEDALENITHSICTLEFEDQRPFYDWLLERLAEGGLLQRPLPQQIEFSRLNLTYVVLSKRKLIQLVEEKHVDGWDDPRMPTLVGARRAATRPKASACSPSASASRRHDSLIDYVVFEDCDARSAQRVGRAPRRRARPAQADHRQLPGRAERGMPSRPTIRCKPELGKRSMPFSRELWIEAEDFMEEPSKGFHRLFPATWRA